MKRFKLLYLKRSPVDGEEMLQEELISADVCYAQGGILFFKIGNPNKESFTKRAFGSHTVLELEEVEELEEKICNIDLGE